MLIKKAFSVDNAGMNIRKASFLTVLLVCAAYGGTVGNAWASPNAEHDSENPALKMANKNQAIQHFQLGKNLQQRKLYQGAILEFGKALALDPGWEEARLALSWAKQDLARNQQLETKQAASLPDLIKKAQSFYDRGRRLEAEENLIDAALAYKEALATLAGFPEAKLALKRIQAKAGTSPERPPVENTPREPLQNTVNASSSSSEQALNILGNQPKTSKLATDIVRSHPANTARVMQTAPAADTKVSQAVQMHYLNGTQSYDSGDYAAAIAEFQLILEFVPHHKGALYKLEQARKKRAEEIAVAERKIEEAAAAGDTVGKLKAMHDMTVMDPDNRKISEAWDLARNQNQDLVEKLYRQGVDLYARENYTDALKKWEMALNLNPYHKKSTESIKQVREKLLRISDQKQ